MLSLADAQSARLQLQTIPYCEMLFSRSLTYALCHDLKATAREACIDRHSVQFFVEGVTARTVKDAAMQIGLNLTDDLCRILDQAAKTDSLLYVDYAFTNRDGGAVGIMFDDLDRYFERSGM